MYQRMNRKRDGRGGTMRVTRNMMIESSAYWNAKQLSALNDISTEVSSGNRVNKPSDDPSDYARILKDRTTISKYAQYEANITKAQTWVSENDTTLEAIYSLLGDAKEVLSTASETSADNAEELTSLYDQLLDYVNSTDSTGVYIYSGTDSSTAPYIHATTISGGTADDIVYDLANDAASVTIKITDASGNVVRTMTVSGGIEGTNSVAWDGKNDSGNTVDDGTYNYTLTAIDSSGDAVATYPTYGGNSEGKTVSIGENASLTFTTDGSAIFGAAIKVLSQAITALQSSSYDTNKQQTLLASLNDAMSDVENATVSLSNKNTQLETAEDRWTALTTAVQSNLSDFQLTDSSTAATELKVQQTNYEEATAVLAKLLDMSKLTDYL